MFDDMFDNMFDIWRSKTNQIIEEIVDIKVTEI